MEKLICCDKCKSQIKSKDDLVVTMEALSIVAYHEKCYVQNLKTMRSIFLGSPVNSKTATWGIIMGGVMAIILAFTDLGPQKWILLGAIVVATMVRLASYLKYEKNLE